LNLTAVSKLDRTQQRAIDAYAFTILTSLSGCDRLLTSISYPLTSDTKCTKIVNLVKTQAV